jgi:hypothetical protein
MNMFEDPDIEVPQILAIPDLNGIPPYYDAKITESYGYWDEYCRFGVHYDKWTPDVVTVNLVA